MKRPRLTRVLGVCVGVYAMTIMGAIGLALIWLMSKAITPVHKTGEYGQM